MDTEPSNDLTGGAATSDAANEEKQTDPGHPAPEGGDSDDSYFGDEELTEFLPDYCVDLVNKLCFKNTKYSSIDEDSDIYRRHAFEYCKRYVELVNSDVSPDRLFMQLRLLRKKCKWSWFLTYVYMKKLFTDSKNALNEDTIQEP